ncbi:SRPBCC family protein [Promicromonospora iranensis]|uniref:Uncharacterized protein YndB with AHSA1/START domain n=1 Tax=Promicromonospora iranensis TaxID=1105144 RepID=A0ABU2CT46_9MICO|nr:SRPBCC domain-containing protein [Promicromonospora iranensis]MDR7384494.1 uncharacterized protein YndB with AHSA1/START domain [Promicromonospora iranensis]
MSAQNYTTSFTVHASPDEVFAAITRPQAWWTEMIEGGTTESGDEFGFDNPGLHRTRIRLTEVVPGTKMVWHVLENHFGFVQDQSEWVGSDIVFELADGPEGDTAVRVTHVGLVPELECYDVCSAAWNHHLAQGLRGLVEAGHADVITAENAARQARDVGIDT